MNEARPIADANADAPPSADPVHERALFFGISASRVRSRVRWGCILLILSFLIPYNTVGTTPIFAWDVLGELRLSSALALLALPLAGIALAIGSFVTKRGASLGFLVLGALLSAALLRKLGADRAAWDLVRVPDAFSTRPAGAILAIALTAAAANLKFRSATRHTVPYVLGLAGLSALYFYFWPDRGEAPFHTVIRALIALPDMPDFRYQIGTLLLVFLMIWPLVITLLGLSLIKVTPPKDESWFAIVANWTLTLHLLLLVTRALMMPQPGLSAMVYLLTVLVVTAVIVMTSSAVAIVVESFFVPSGDEVMSRSTGNFDDIIALGADPFEPTKETKAIAPKGMLPKRAAMVAGGAVAVLAVTQFALSRPPSKGTDWDIDEPTKESDLVFGSAFRDWARARRQWDLSARLKSGSEARVDVKDSGRELVQASKDVSKDLSAAFETLVAESDDLDLAGNKWSRLVHGVNEASRASKLPYYIDPDFIMSEDQEKGEVRYHFMAHVYRIRKVNQFDVDGDKYATLHVESLDQNAVDHLRLGFSRDEQPFALVNLDAILRKTSEFQALVKQGYCSDGLVLNMRVYQGLEECGKKLQAYASERESEIAEAVVLGTERHELQHQIDGPHLPLAGAVLNLLEGFEPSAQDRVNRETSAFLAELTTDGIAPKLALVQLAQYLFSSEEQKGVYAKTAVVIFEAMAERSIRRGFIVDGEKFWAAYDKLFELSDDKLRARAREVWEEFFDDELAQPKLK
ncbi:MAG: hypothetical protein HOW73_20985 [Polyangiaceae bacterium]|nr:hypothetical protein [Polyangiaceae bacterium]